MGIVSLTTYSNYNALGNDFNIVGTFSGGEEIKFTDKHVSSPLMNYVEPYEIGGIEKTLFYTEVNTDIKVGDRVFIVNGNYDSAELIKTDKYKKGRDGYKVLYVDRCRIVLDIDYSGVRPNNGDIEVGDLMSDYIKIHNLDSYDSFITANRQLTSRGGYLGGKFDYYQNNIAFIDTDYPATNDGWTKTNGVTASPGFYVREPAYDPNLINNTTGMNWTNISDVLMSGTFSLASSKNNPINEYKYFNNSKILIVGENFTYKGLSFIGGTVYRWSASDSSWIPDIKEKGMNTRAIITKANFRQGDFKGTFYSGVYGNKDKRNIWNGDGSWYGGTLFNTLWTGGRMYSRILLLESFRSYVDQSRKPQQKLNTYNNGGYGFNFVIDSEFNFTNIDSAIVRNTRFGLTPSLPVVENYITGKTQNFEHLLNNGLFEFCQFNNTSISGGAIKNSRLSNSMLQGVKYINSWSRNSVIKNSTLVADSLIKIDSYDEWSASESRGSQLYGSQFSDGMDFKVYKFYIGEADFLKLKHGDSFYLKGIKIDKDPELLNLFDRRFTIGSWTEYVDEFNSTGQTIDDEILPDLFYKKGILCAAFLVSIEENEWIYNSIRYDKPTSTGIQVNGFLTDTLFENPNPQYSIDIFVATNGTDRLPVSGLNFNFSTQSVSSMTYIRPETSKNRVDVTDAYVIDADVESGLIDDCTWFSGNNINYNKDLVITGLTNSNDISTYNVTFDSVSGNISITTLANTLRPEIVDRRSKILESDIRVGDILFINGLDYYSSGKVVNFSISNPGTFYTDSFEAIGLSYSGASSSRDGYGFLINYTTTNGQVTGISVAETGFDYRVGDLLYIRNQQQGSLYGPGGVDASITITEVDKTPPVRLPDSWKVIQYSPPNVVLEPLYGKEIVKGLTQNGVFRTAGSDNRWLSFSRTKIANSRLKSGIFRRSTLTNNNIENLDYDATDRDFTNMTAIKSLVMSDIIFNNTGNRLSLATYNNSSIFGGTDEWHDGIIYRSVLNKMTFNRGIIKQSSWLDGTFNGGLFYMSNSYDAKPLPGFESFDTNRVLSSHKGGKTINGLRNDRFSWRKGIFNGGQFLKSDWESGIFRDGEFYGSKWYGGTATGGVFGKEFTATEETVFYNGVVEYTTVSNATFVADDSSRTGVTNSIVWHDGVFNGGVFGSRRNFLEPVQRVVKTYVIDPNQNPPLYSSSFGGFESRSIMVGENVSDVTEISLKLEIENDSSLNLKDADLADIRIYLEGPAGKRILVKDYGTSPGDKLLSTFTSNTSKLSLGTGTYPYIGEYRFALSSPDIASSSLVTDVKGLIGGLGTLGNWAITVTNRSFYSFGLRFYAEINLISEKQPTKYIENSAIWNDGTFNSGQFISYARWMNGDFNGGKFTSTKGQELSGLYNTKSAPETHSWVNGRFNGGEFGNSSTAENSTWANGEFRGGIFAGKVWSDGIFKNGLFLGSGQTASGGWDLNTVATASAAKFVDSFNSNFYGLWRNGLVTASDLETGAGSNPNLELSPGQLIIDNKKSVSMNNILWVDGIFDHTNGSISNSVWLGGTFSRGNFEKGTFNAFAKRPSESVARFSDSAFWLGGNFKDGDFFYSEWSGGNFIYGTGFGMWFKDGVSYYMNAINVTWGTTFSFPRWKNGNWDGSPFDYNGEILNDVQLQVIRTSLFRNVSVGLSDIKAANLHIWNIFDDSGTLAHTGLSVRGGQIQTHLPKYTPIYLKYTEGNGSFPIKWD